jgi:glycine/D-amino acid oxidase-like deaminating enzyme/nitrite reductase/ring-hydroxylating ferredoxin subunit
MAELGVRSYWDDSASIPKYPSLDRDLTVDVVIVGAGITGLTAGYLLKRAGRTVAVIDRRRSGGVDTTRTTAHATCVTDRSLSELVATFGRDHAQAVWDAGLAAIDQIDTTIRAEEIACEWSWVPGYKHAALDSDLDAARSSLREEAALAADLGFDATYLDPIPFLNRPGMMVEGQAKFHPRKYLGGLAKCIHGDGSYIFEHTESKEVTDSPLAVKTANGHTISCDGVVIATHTPLTGKSSIVSATLLQTKLYLYSSYALGGRIPKGTAPEALYWDTADPYHYLRIDRHRDYDYAIFGGEDHKTGQVSDTTRCYRLLERAFRGLMPQVEIAHRWSGQVIETNDGLPYIGETSPRQFVATGFGGNGMTFGTLGGLMASDALEGRRNPWGELFDVGRTKVRGGTWDYLKENLDYPYYLARDRFAGTEGRSLRAVPRGQGRILTLNGKTVAAWRSDGGKVTLLSSVCTHLGCRVDWNEAERTWDCPCHGSRFTPTGAVLAGPAETPLERVDAT